MIFLLVILASFSCNNPGTRKAGPEEKPYTNSDGFRFDLPGNCRDVTLDEVGVALRDVNPAIIFVAIAELPDENTVFSVSAYDLGVTMPIDSVFRKNLHFHSTVAGEPVADYKTVDYGIRNRDNKKMYYKISYNPETKYSVIYYVIQNDNADISYEFKIICQSEDKLTDIQEFLEEIALSARFNDQ